MPTELEVIRSSSAAPRRSCAGFHGARASVDARSSRWWSPPANPPPSPKLRGSVGAGDTRWTRALLARLRLQLLRASCAAQPSYTDGKHNQTRVRNPTGHSKFHKLSEGRSIFSPCTLPLSLAFKMEAFKGLGMKHIRLKGA